MTTCTNCSAAISNGLTLCSRCTTTLATAGANTAAYYRDIDRIRPGQRLKVKSVYQSTPPSALTSRGRDRISDALASADRTVTAWVDRVTADQMPVSTDNTTPGNALWISQNATRLATRPWAHELLVDLVREERHLKRILDRSDTGWYAGICGAPLHEPVVHDGTVCGCSCHQDGGECDIEGGCGIDIEQEEGVYCTRPLYATDKAAFVSCPSCGAHFDAAERRDVMLADAREQVAPISVIARAVVGLLDTEASVERLANRISQWVRRKKLADLGSRVQAGGRPQRVYLLGDVFDLIEETEKRRRDTTSIGRSM